MFKGGYKIINLKGIKLIPNGNVVIKGIYESLESNYGKATLLSGLYVDRAYNDMFVTFVASGTNFKATTDIGTITVRDDDTVSFNVVSTDNGSIG